MPMVLVLLVLCAEPAPALKSLAGLNLVSLKPWLLQQLPSLGQCGLPGATEGEAVVSVQARFGAGPDVSVTRVDATLSDVGCVRGVVERWRSDGKQPRAGPFSFSYRFRPSAAQREAVVAQARAAFPALCAALPSQGLTAAKLTQLLAASKPALPMGAWVALEDAAQEQGSLESAEGRAALGRAWQEAATALQAPHTCPALQGKATTSTTAR